MLGAVKLAALEAQDVVPDLRQARLSGALDHQPPDDVMRDDRLDRLTADHSHQRFVVDVAHLADDVTFGGAFRPETH